VIDAALVDRLYGRAHADRWRVPRDRFAQSLAASVERGVAAKDPSPRELERYLGSLHLEDLALACACASGDEQAWEYFVLEYRPLLYRAADAIDPGGGARDLADGLYAELFGVERKPLLRYFHGRSSLGTWLRAVLAQRHVDRIRSGRRLEPLPEEASASALAAAEPPDPARERYVGLMAAALKAALAALPARERFRVACYYGQQMTLAQIGESLGEHEASASRGLAKARREIRRTVEEELRREGLPEAEISECFQSVAEDPGALDLGRLLQEI